MHVAMTICWTGVERERTCLSNEYLLAFFFPPSPFQISILNRLVVSASRRKVFATVIESVTDGSGWLFVPRYLMTVLVL